jgi:nickel/cobalt exporter
VIPLAQAAPISPLETRFLELIDLPAPTPLVAVTALAVAFGIGAAHALAPGHGKAVAAAYLVGSRGQPRDALLLGGAVAAMHTASVLVLGLGLHLLARGWGAERTGPWLTLAAAALVLVVGIGALMRTLRARRPRVPARTAHARDDDHGHGHTHADLPGGVSPLSRRGLVLIGMSGGLLPSPSAFLVLTTALFTGRMLFGLALVAAFSLGLAASLGLVGLAVLHGRELVVRRSVRSPRLAAVLNAMPLLSALAITAAGAWLATTALRTLA